MLPTLVDYVSFSTPGNIVVSRKYAAPATRSTGPAKRIDAFIMYTFAIGHPKISDPPKEPVTHTNSASGEN